MHVQSYVCKSDSEMPPLWQKQNKTWNIMILSVFSFFFQLFSKIISQHSCLVPVNADYSRQLGNQAIHHIITSLLQVDLTLLPPNPGSNSWPLTSSRTVLLGREKWRIERTHCNTVITLRPNSPLLFITKLILFIDNIYTYISEKKFLLCTLQIIDTLHITVSFFQCSYLLVIWDLNTCNG